MMLMLHSSTKNIKMIEEVKVSLHYIMIHSRCIYLRYYFDPCLKNVAMFLLSETKFIQIVFPYGFRVIIATS